MRQARTAQKAAGGIVAFSSLLGGGVGGEGRGRGAEG